MDNKLSGICADCTWSEKPIKGDSKCSCPELQKQDYVTGKSMMEYCYAINIHGLCKEFQLMEENETKKPTGFDAAYDELLNMMDNHIL